LPALITADREDSKPTAGFQRVIQRAVIHVQSSGREEVTGANVLVAIFAERESHAAYFLQEQDMTRYDAVNYISHGIAKRPGQVSGIPPRARRRQAAGGVERGHGVRWPRGRQEEDRRADALEAYCVDLNKKAGDGKIDPLIGRDPRSTAPSRFSAAVRRTTRCFVGDPGVGKTAIAEGLARKIINRRGA
jgi:ATP-dependent Clp protease ATP-binding subunit ClpA